MVGSVSQRMEQVVRPRTLLSVFRGVKHLVGPSEPVEGEVVDVDTGYESVVVVTVERNGDTYYETYELTDVEPAKSTRGPGR